VVVNSCSSNEQKYYYARYSSAADVKSLPHPQPKAEA
jgi:hypothetical protein